MNIKKKMLSLSIVVLFYKSFTIFYVGLIKVVYLVYSDFIRVAIAFGDQIEHVGAGDRRIEHLFCRRLSPNENLYQVLFGRLPYGQRPSNVPIVVHRNLRLLIVELLVYVE